MNKEFWDIKAGKYPRPFEEKNINSFRSMMERMNRFGVSFAGKRIIDIGCGTGNYGLLFAQEAKEVFCLDFSGNMIDARAAEAASRKIKNVSWIKSSFSDFDISGLEKGFDISFASMTPAVKSEKDVLKMEVLAGEFCVFVGWAGKRENRIADKIISAHGIDPYSPKGFIEVREILRKRGISFSEETFENSWNWSGSIEEAVEDLSARIKLDGKSPDTALIKSILEKQFPSGKVDMETFAAQGMLIWKP